MALYPDFPPRPRNFTGASVCFSFAVMPPPSGGTSGPLGPQGGLQIPLLIPPEGVCAGLSLRSPLQPYGLAWGATPRCWLRREELKLRPFGYEPNALPLRHSDKLVGRLSGLSAPLRRAVPTTRLRVLLLFACGFVNDCLDHSGIGIASYFLLILTNGSPLLVRSNSPFLDG